MPTLFHIHHLIDLIVIISQILVAQALFKHKCICKTNKQKKTLPKQHRYKLVPSHISHVSCNCTCLLETFSYSFTISLMVFPKIFHINFKMIISLYLVELNWYCTEFRIPQIFYYSWLFYACIYTSYTHI